MNKLKVNSILYGSQSQPQLESLFSSAMHDPDTIFLGQSVKLLHETLYLLHADDKQMLSNLQRS